MKIFAAPQHTRFILPPFHPTKSSLHCVGGIFLFRGKLHFENFRSRTAMHVENFAEQNV